MTSFSQRLLTFARSALAGGAATLVDLGVIATAVGLFHVSPRAANVPALLAGAVVQFFGNRCFAFRAQEGSLPRQAALFVLAEAITLGLNGVLYHAVVTHVALGAAGAVIVRALTTNAVFVLWSYPVWKRIFQPAPA
jgi:putative flippase GtrA